MLPGDIEMPIARQDDRSPAMTSRPRPGLSPPPPIQQAHSFPVANQQFPTLRPPPTPSRDGRARSAPAVNGNQVPPKPDPISYDNFNDLMTQK